MTHSLLKPADDIRLAPLALDKHTELTLRNEAAIRERDELLEAASGIECVRGETSQQMATDMLGKLQGMLSAGEKSRKEVKAPFIKIGKVIEAVWSSFSDPVEKEKARLKKLLTDYQLELDRIAAEEARKAAAEVARIEAEKRRVQEEAERIAREAAEAERKAQEAAAAATNAEERRKAQEAQLAAQAAAAIAQQKADLQAAQLSIQQAETVQVPAVTKAEGMTVKRTRVFQVTDMEALYHAYPRLVKMEPRTAEINKLIREQNEDGSYKLAAVPGLELSMEVDVGAR